MTDIRQPDLHLSTGRRVLLYVLGVILPILVAYYLHVWLAGKVRLGYFRSGDVLFCKGRSEVQKDVTLLVEKVYYRNDSFDRLRIVEFLITNYGTRSLAGGTEFCFVAKGTDMIPAAAVVAVSTNPVEDGSSITLAEQKFFDGVGPGFIFRSAFSGKAKLEVQLVLDVTISPRLQDAAIEMKQVASLEPSTLRRLGETTLTLTFGNFVMWLVLSAGGYAGTWLVINIVTGNHSSGARMVSWTCEAVFGKGFIRKAEAGKPRDIDNHNDGDRNSRPSEGPANLSE